MLYDDEGGVLILLKDFSGHGARHDKGCSQYGPLPPGLFDMLHRAGRLFTHPAGRLVMLFFWSVAVVQSPPAAPIRAAALPIAG